MSIIFNSLQKLDPENCDAFTRQLPEGIVAVAQGEPCRFTGGPSNLKRILRMVVAVTGFIILGYCMVFAIEYVMGREPVSADISAKSSRMTEKPFNSSIAVTKDIPRSTAQPNPNSAGPDVVRAQFYPPNRQMAGTQATTADEPKDIESHPVPMDISPPTRITSALDSSEEKEAFSERVIPKTALQGAIGMTPDKETSSTDTPLAERNPSLQARVSHSAAPFVPLSDPSPAERAFEKEQLRAEKNRIQTVLKNARISRLARQTQTALAQEPIDLAQAGNLLEKLSQEKGADHPFVTKLKAYFLYKQNRLAEAATILEGVIAADPDDIEAGVNLALIEIQNGQMPKALDRLKRLGVDHPGNGMVADLIRKLQK